MRIEITCKVCHGEGYTSQYHSYPCIECKGKGFIIEMVEPDTNDPSQFPADGNDIVNY